MKAFPPGRPMLPPDSARNMEARNFEPIEWSSELHKLVVAEFVKLRDHFEFNPIPDSVWDDAEPFMTTPPNFGRTKRKPRQAHRGNCNSFAPLLRRKLEAKGLPLKAMRLLTCEIVTKATKKRIGHMVLVIKTIVDGEPADLICCNLAGCWPLVSEEWDNKAVRYDWRRMEDAGPAWVNVGSQGLDEVVEMV